MIEVSKEDDLEGEAYPEVKGKGGEKTSGLAKKKAAPGGEKDLHSSKYRIQWDLEHIGGRRKNHRASKVHEGKVIKKLSGAARLVTGTYSCKKTHCGGEG